MSPLDQSITGKVYLVGAGPGDPGLITLRGAECLRRADVVLYDYLVNPQILRHVRPHAIQVCLGQHGHSRIWTQGEINAELIKLACAGKVVVRLKGGDPAVFARGAEEIDALVQNGVSFEIVPGITVALAASSYAGIPITRRGFASAVALVTGQEDEQKAGESLDYRALAHFPGTLIIYMGVTTAHQWTKALIEAGKSPTTPCAIIRRCSFADQRTILCRLDEVVHQMSSVRPPAIVVIGEVTRLAESYSWFERRPLSGTRILVTRAQEQSHDLSSPLNELGADVIHQPAIQIEPPADWSVVDAVISRLGTFDWIVFSSANGVDHFLKRLWDVGHDWRVLSHLKIAAIGPGTTHALERHHLRIDVQPPEFRAEALAAALAPAAHGLQFLLIRANRGREVLAEQLRAAGGNVEQVVVYQSHDVTAPDPGVLKLMEQGRIEWVTITSSAIARSLVSMFGNRLGQTKLASISPITSATIRELGFVPAVEAHEYTMDGLVAAIMVSVGSARS